MQRYKFKAVDAAGNTQRGEGNARSQETLIAELRARGLTILEVRAADEEQPRTEQRAPSKMSISFGVSRKALSLFTRQLATTLTAGLPLLRILSVLHRKTENSALRKMLETAGQELQKGSSFSDALAKHARVFDPMYLNMVRVGEAGGLLPQTMTRLAMMLEKEVALRRKIRAAMSYPIFVLVFSASMAYALLAFLMPMFTPMFEASGLDIPKDYPLTYWLIKGSKVATDPWMMGGVVGGVLVLWVVLKLMASRPRGRYVLDLVKFNLPLFHDMVQQAATARFCRCFATLLQSGVPLLQALQLVADAAGNMVVARSIHCVAANIQSGDRISETLESVHIFPDLVVQMAEIGEEAGTLPEMLEKVAEYYEEELDATVSSMTSIIEPAMMLFIGAIVGVFVMGILLPILGISTAYQSTR